MRCYSVVIHCLGAHEETSIGIVLNSLCLTSTISINHINIRNMLHSPLHFGRVSDVQDRSTTATATDTEKLTRHSNFKGNIPQATWQTKLV